MPRMLKTIDEYTAVDRKRDTYFMVFNKAFNSNNILKDEYLDIFDRKNIDNIAREEFINFMKNNFPNTKLTDVFDMFPAGYIQFPYLGTIALDCDENDEVYKALCEKYEDENGKPKSMSAVFWVISYELALKNYREVQEFWKDELGEDY